MKKYWRIINEANTKKITKNTTKIIKSTTNTEEKLVLFKKQKLIYYLNS
jgi:hypothetical protein